MKERAQTKPLKWGCGIGEVRAGKYVEVTFKLRSE